MTPRRSAGRTRGTSRRFAAGCIAVGLAACDIDGVTPNCPPDASTCVTLPAGYDASAATSGDDGGDGAAADGADGGTAASP